ncbi:restriction endonuclease subunit S [Mesorhizobium sp. WSM3882]|uniref:restriction endonuclease subunit S n=1 Tax=Mesorhizobium sp. WSM3882 TaxID=2029407 RepID=UPI000BB01575|nr:restriction endonuclease subunit S [Mesorhizobium sp. WSM3882]PBB34339.1 hypothetical protein CK214_08505 [Mesorhizobium sp. WSM3882]
MTVPQVPIGAVFDVKSGATPASSESGYWDGDIPWITPADLGALAGREIAKGSRNISQDGYESCGTQMVPAGSLILSIRAPIGHLAITNAPVCFNQGCRGLVPRHAIRTDYAYWAVLAQKSALEAAGQGTTFVELARTKLRGVKISLPDLGTQKTIASFLEREITRTDQLIAKKQQQLSLLSERVRRSVSDLAVGHIPNDQASVATGLDYIPSIPANWTLRRAGHLFQQVTEPNTDDLPVLSVSIHSGISDRQLDDEERDRKVNLIEDRSSYKRVRPGYLAYNMMRAWQGAIGVSAVQGAVSPAYVVAKPTCDLHSPYYQFLLRTPTFIEQMRQRSKGITDFRLRLYWEQFRQIMLPVPPLAEQQRIAHHAEQALSYTASIVEKVAASVERLKEHRAALITAAVTGQIEVGQKVTTGAARSDRSKFRLLVSAEIIYRHQGNPKFGRVKLHKELFLAEAHAGISELQGNYLREAAGPFDRAMIDDTERALEAEGFYRASQRDGTGTAVLYTPLAKAGQHKAELEALLGPKITDLRSLIATLRDLDRREVEAVATLYAVWNDAMIDGETPDDAAIIRGVLTEWHTEKGEKFRSDDLSRWLGWMKRQSLTPRGAGPKTTTGRLFV